MPQAGGIIRMLGVEVLASSPFTSVGRPYLVHSWFGGDTLSLGVGAIRDRYPIVDHD